MLPIYGEIMNNYKTTTINNKKGIPGILFKAKCNLTCCILIKNLQNHLLKIYNYCFTLYLGRNLDFNIVLFMA